MKKQRDRARQARNSDNSMGVQTDLLIGVKSPSEYVGYTQLEVEKATISDILADGALVQSTEGEYARLFLTRHRSMPKWVVKLPIRVMF